MEEDLFWCASLPGKELEISLREKRGKFLSSLFSLFFISERERERERDNNKRKRERGELFCRFLLLPLLLLFVVCASEVLLFPRFSSEDNAPERDKSL